MGMSYKEDAAKKKQDDLKRRLIAQQGCQINEFGEIIRNGENESQNETSNKNSNNNDAQISLSTLSLLAEAFSKQQEKQKVWEYIKLIIFAYLGSALSIILLPSWFSPIYFFRTHLVLFYSVIFLALFCSVSYYSKWYLFKKENNYDYLKTSSNKRKIWGSIWICLSLYMLFTKNPSFPRTIGIVFFIICIIFASIKEYQFYKYIRDKRI